MALNDPDDKMANIEKAVPDTEHIKLVDTDICT